MAGYVVLIDSRQGAPNVAYPTVPTFRPGGGFRCQGYYINGTPLEHYGNGNCAFVREDDALAFAHRVQLLTQGSHWHDPTTVRVVIVSKDEPLPAFSESSKLLVKPLWRHRQREATKGTDFESREFIHS